MFVQILILILGFFLLYKGSGLLVDGSTSLAQKLKISSLVIGLTIVAFGTSLPELFINLCSNFYQLPDIGIGSVIGANIASILLITGLSALICPILIKKELIRKELPLAIFAILLLLILANNFFTGVNATSFIGRIDGIIFLIFFLIFLYYAIGRAKKEKAPLLLPKKINWLIAIAYMIIGIAGLAVGSSFVIMSGSKIATGLGLTNAAIALSIIAIGMTLPEMFTAVRASWQKNTDLAIGNIVGSIMFNILFILGLSSLIKPLPYNHGFNTEIIIGLMSVLLIYYFTLNGKKERKLERWEGGLLLAFYIAYLAFVIFRT